MTILSVVRRVTCEVEGTASWSAAAWIDHSAEGWTDAVNADSWCYVCTRGKIVKIRFERGLQPAVGLIRDCGGKRGGTTGVLNQRASEEGERERTGYARPKIHRDTALQHRKRE